MQKFPKNTPSMKTGLVLEGGGLRALFTAGILDVLMEHNINVDGVIGVSAGALFGVNYISRQIGRALRYNLMLKDHPDYMGLRCLIRTGEIVGGEFAYHIVPFEIDVVDGDTLRSNPTEFWMVSTDVVNDEPVYHRMTDFNHEELQWLRASASMPVVSHVVEIDGKTMLDGGMIDSIPLKAFQSMGFDRNIVILTQPLDYRKTPTKLGWLFRLCCRKYPKIVEIMKRRHKMYNSQLDYIHTEAQKGNTLLIYPKESLNIGRTELNEHKMRAVYNQGREIAEQRLQEIKDFLGLSRLS